MKKRFIDGSISAVIFLFIWLFIEIPTTTIKGLFDDDYAEYLLFKIFACIHSMFYPLSSQGAVYSLLYRFWMIYFEFIYCESLKNEQWKIQINPVGSSKKEKWIIEHRGDYGNSKWIINRLIIIFIMVSLITSLMQWFVIFDLMHNNIAQSIDSSLYIIPCICIFILWYKMPSFLDSFMVRHELKWIIICYIFGLLLNIICLITFSLIIPDILYYIENIFWNLNVLFVGITLIFIQTQYILIKIKSNDDYYKNVLHSMHKHSIYSIKTDRKTSSSTLNRINSLSDLRAISPSSSSDGMVNINKDKYKLCDILQDKVTFKLFMYHLTTELSTECIFAFIEFTQFRFLLQSNDQFIEPIHRFIQSEPEIHKICKFVPPKKRGITNNTFDQIVLLDENVIPLSHIVYIKKYNDNDIDINRYKYIILALGHKYIYDDGDFCINISWNTRRDIIEWINLYCCNNNNDDIQFEIQQRLEMYYLFEKCRAEMYKLMKHTLYRFVKTNQFLSLQNKFVD